MAILFDFSPTASHLHPLQAENCDNSSRRVVNEDDNGKFRLEKVKTEHISVILIFFWKGSHLSNLISSQPIVARVVF